VTIDISRDSFDPLKNYTGVLLQQGRALVDAEWNEQVAVINHQMRKSFAELTKSLGPCCGEIKPNDRGDGFRVQMGNGSFFVDGVRCESKREVEVSCPFDLVGSEWTLSVHAWEAIEQCPAMQDPALAGADSGLRTKIEWNLQIDIGKPDGDYQKWINTRRGAINVECIEKQPNIQPSLYTIEITKDALKLENAGVQFLRDGTKIDPSKGSFNEDGPIELDNRIRLTFQKKERIYRKNDRWLVPYRASGTLGRWTTISETMLPSGQHYFALVNPQPLVFGKQQPNSCSGVGASIHEGTLPNTTHAFESSPACFPLYSAAGLIDETSCFPFKKWLSTALLNEITTSDFDSFFVKLLAQLRLHSTDPKLCFEAKRVWTKAHSVMSDLRTKSRLGSLFHSA
jgi:hypothetical protein